MATNIYPRTYSKAVYQAVGRTIMQCKSTKDMMDLLNESKVLNFKLFYQDARSMHFIKHMDMILNNPQLPSYDIIMAESLKYMPDHHWIEDKEQHGNTS